MPLFTEITHMSVREWVASALVSKGVVRKELAYDLDCSVSAIKSYVHQVNTPNLPQFLRMCRSFGPEFVNFILAKIGMTGAHWIGPMTICHRETHYFFASVGEKYAAFFRNDGLIDEEEDAQLKFMFIEGIPRMAAHLAN